MTDNHTLLDGPPWFDEVKRRHLLQTDRKDYEGKILHKFIYEDMSEDEAKKKLGNISEKEFMRKIIVYLGTDPLDVEDFEKEYGEPFYI
jgi:hypothetical protein